MGFATAMPVNELHFQIDVYDPCGSSIETATSSPTEGDTETSTSSPEMQRQLQASTLLVLSNLKLKATILKTTVAERLSNPGLVFFLEQIDYPGIRHFSSSEAPPDTTEHLQLLSATTANYTVLVHHMKEREMLWAGYTNGLIERDVTYEEEITSFERAELATALCSYKLVLNSYGVAWNSDVVGLAEFITYTAPTSHSLADMEAIVLWSSLIRFVDYQTQYIWELQNSI